MSGNVADAVLEILAAVGVKSMYGVSGDTIFPLLDAVSRQDRIKYYSAVHESGAAFMASYEAKLTGRPAVCVATSGPGAANLVNGLADAYFDGAPVIAVTGQVETKKIGTNAKQFFHQPDLVKTFAAVSETVVSPVALIPVMMPAVKTAVDRKTVAHLSIPEDVLLMPWEWKGPLNGFTGALETSVSLLEGLKRPLIVLGKGDRETAVRCTELADLLGAAIVVAQQAKGAVPDNHPLVIGGIGEGYVPQMVNEADGILVIGEASYEAGFLPHGIPLVHVAEEASKLYYDRLSGGLAGNPAVLLKAVTGRIGPRPGHGNPSWRGRIDQEKESRERILKEDAANNQRPVHPARLIAALNAAVAPDAVITLDIGSIIHWFERGFQAKGQKIIISHRWRSMGAGLPAAIAAQIACPGRQVVALAGDGGFLMTMGELLTAVRYKIPVTAVVAVNHGYILEKQKMQAKGLTPFGYGLTVPGFAGLAEACGARGFRVTDPGQLDIVLREALDCGKTSLVEIVVADTPLPFVQ